MVPHTSDALYPATFGGSRAPLDPEKKAGTLMDNTGKCELSPFRIHLLTMSPYPTGPGCHEEEQHGRTQLPGQFGKPNVDGTFTILSYEKYE